MLAVSNLLGVVVATHDHAEALSLVSIANRQRTVQDETDADSSSLRNTAPEENWSRQPLPVDFLAKTFANDDHWYAINSASRLDWVSNASSGTFHQDAVMKSLLCFRRRDPEKRLSWAHPGISQEKHLEYLEAELPVWSLFDWVFTENVHIVNGDGIPRRVLIDPFLTSEDPFMKKGADANLVERFQKVWSTLPVLTADQDSAPRTVVLAGADVLFSYQNEQFMKELLARFNIIWVEANDDPSRSPHNNIFTVPQGFQLPYLVMAGESNIQAAMSEASSGVRNERRLVCAAWGKAWPQLDAEIPDRVEISGFLEKADWVERTMWESTEFYDNLRRFKFVLAPKGHPIQCARHFEAMLVRTVPVVTEHQVFRDLQAQGFPFLIVKNWTDLSEEFLREQHQQVFSHVDWDDVIHRLSVDGFEHLMVQVEDAFVKA